jgi:hypothetical protein
MQWQLRTWALFIGCPQALGCKVHVSADCKLAKMVAASNAAGGCAVSLTKSSNTTSLLQQGMLPFIFL